MQKSESIKQIATALITFHVKVNKIPKDSSNPFFKSKYASLSAILDAITDPLNESGLSFCQFPSGEHGLTTILMHTSGEWISSEYSMRPSKDDPQGVGSAITYQRRYALAAILGLNIDEDDDGNAASKPTEKKAEVKQPQKEWLNPNTKQWTSAIDYLNAGGAIESIEKKYRITTANREMLLSETIEAAPTK